MKDHSEAKARDIAGSGKMFTSNSEKPEIKDLSKITEILQVAWVSIGMTTRFLKNPTK